MTSDSPPPSDNRRNFVKKSLAAGIISVQPTLLAGLLRAQGGGGQTTSDPWETTDPYSTGNPETTNFWESTTFESTTFHSSSPHDLVIVCTGAPGPSQRVDQNSVAFALDGIHWKSPYKWASLVATFAGPSKGDYSDSGFLLGLTSTLNFEGNVLERSVQQSVGRIGMEITFTKSEVRKTTTGSAAGLELFVAAGLSNGALYGTYGTVASWQEVVDFPPDGLITADITPIIVSLNDYQWTFAVKTREEAEHYRYLLNQ